MGKQIIINLSDDQCKALEITKDAFEQKLRIWVKKELQRTMSFAVKRLVQESNKSITEIEQFMKQEGDIGEVGEECIKNGNGECII